MNNQISFLETKVLRTFSDRGDAGRYKPIIAYMSPEVNWEVFKKLTIKAAYGPLVGLASGMVPESKLTEAKKLWNCIKKVAQTRDIAKEQEKVLEIVNTIMYNEIVKGYEKVFGIIYPKSLIYFSGIPSEGAIPKVIECVWYSYKE